MKTERVAGLRRGLEALVEASSPAHRVRADPVEFARRYQRREDTEVAALVAAAFAYGRADLFRPKVAWLLSRLGPSPGATVRALDVASASRLVEGFVYRFNVATDAAVLLLGAGRLLREEGTLEAPLAAALGKGATLHQALSRWLARLRDVPLARLRKHLGRERGLHHLLPMPLGPGAAKRWNMFLRWMVRGPDGVDVGLWRSLRPSQLVIPLDTHVHRIARRVGWTRRKDASWRTAEEVTAALRQIRPDDPVRFDFALCHHGMVGGCPPRLNATHCRACPLRAVCSTGRRLLR